MHKKSIWYSGRAQQGTVNRRNAHATTSVSKVGHFGSAEKELKMLEGKIHAAVAVNTIFEKIIANIAYQGGEELTCSEAVKTL